MKTGDSATDYLELQNDDSSRNRCYNAQNQEFRIVSRFGKVVLETASHFSEPPFGVSAIGSADRFPSRSSHGGTLRFRSIPSVQLLVRASCSIRIVVRGVRPKGDEGPASAAPPSSDGVAGGVLRLRRRTGFIPGGTSFLTPASGMPAEGQPVQPSCRAAGDLSSQLPVESVRQMRTVESVSPALPERGIGGRDEFQPLVADVCQRQPLRGSQSEVGPTSVEACLHA